MNLNIVANRIKKHFLAEDAPVLSRSLLLAGGVEAIYAKDSPDMPLVSETEQRRSLKEALAVKPAGDVWLFGYGSLIWNPAIRTVESKIAKIQGWHRSFCLSVTAGRGTPANPGLVLALDTGGDCIGTAYRIADENVETELELLWRREMVCGSYIPRWVEVRDDEGNKFGYALAFTINPESPRYVKDMNVNAIIECLSTASGGLGTAADYLLRTRDGLRQWGIPDAELEWLSERVEITCYRHRVMARQQVASNRQAAVDREYRELMKHVTSAPGEMLPI